MSQVLILIASLATASALAIFRCQWALHKLQLDSYSNGRLLRWLILYPLRRLLEPRSLAIGATLIVISAAAARYGTARLYVLLAWAIACAALLLKSRRQPPAKKPLVYTSRAKRLLVTSSMLCVALACATGASAWPTLVNTVPSVAVTCAIVCEVAIVQGAPILVIIANIVLMPLQRAINSHYILLARQKLETFKPTVIGVAGSYGKTSTKYYIESLLKSKYRVLKTPQSFNTLLGVCRAVNEQLTPEHQVFIVEMGAYRRGDVRQIAELVRPVIGVLTSIGPEHLERFKTLENIKATNYELIEALKPSGVGIFNIGEGGSPDLADQAATTVRAIRYSAHPASGAEMWAENTSLSSEGMSFTLVHHTAGQAEVHTRILGVHNVSNIVGAACVAFELGVSLPEIARSLASLEAAPHRLQLINASTGVTIIDDSYNSNPVGAKEALNLLAQFNGGRRVLVTPGMVELGPIQDHENEAFGRHAAEICDYVILVGLTQTRAIAQGLASAGFASEKLRVVENLEAGTAELRSILRPGDTVLFENDLPDLYAEG